MQFQSKRGRCSQSCQGTRTGVMVLLPLAACSWGQTLLGCARAQPPSLSLLCSSGWVLQDGTTWGRALSCPPPPPSPPSSSSLACQGVVWWTNSATFIFKMQGQFLAGLLGRQSRKATLRRTTLWHVGSKHLGTPCAPSLRSNANRDTETGSCACQ